MARLRTAGVSAPPRKASTRAQLMSLRQIKDSLLSRHSTLPNAFVYTPIRDYSLDDVWTYLLQVPNPWGANNDDLLALYRNSTAGECPLVVDTTTPSCGSSRFGCWVCTVVTKDKAMEAMIDNGDEWLEPLLELRDFLAATQDPKRKAAVRGHVRRNGLVMLKSFGDTDDPFVRGPYTLEFCQEVLRRVVARRTRSTEACAEASGSVADPRGRAVGNPSDLALPGGMTGRTLCRVIYEQETGHSLTLLPDDRPGNLGNRRRSPPGGTRRQTCTSARTLVKRLIDTERDLQGLQRRAKIMDQLGTALTQEWRSEADIVAEIALTKRQRRDLQDARA